MSIRAKLTLSYAGFLMLAGTLLLAAVWVFLLRYVPDRALLIESETDLNGVFPVRSNLLRVFAPRAAAVLALLLVVGLIGGWFLAGRMLAPLTQITEATRKAEGGSLSHQIRLPGRRDEFRALADSFDAMLPGSNRTLLNRNASPPMLPTSCELRWRSPRRFSMSPGRIPPALRMNSSSASTA